MSEVMNVSDFLASYDLLDKGVEKVDKKDNFIEILFDLTHVDEPVMNDFLYWDCLRTKFPTSSVVTDHNWDLDLGSGTVLELNAEEASFTLGIEWMVKGSQDHHYFLYRFACGPAQAVYDQRLRSDD